MNSPERQTHIGAGHSPRSDWVVTLSIATMFCLSLQVAHFLYDYVKRGTQDLSPPALFNQWTKQITHPVELAGIAIAISVCLGIYFCLRGIRRQPLRVQLMAAAFAAMVGTFVFSLAVSTVIALLGYPLSLQSFILLNLQWLPTKALWAGIALTLTYNFEARDRERRLAMVEAQAREARMQALRYQVNPHLLYNTLNSIAALILDNKNELAEEMVVRLADFFRASLSKPSHSSVPLSEEIAFQELYLTIEKLRFGDRLSYEFRVDRDAEQVSVPSLILQPLIENTLKHAVHPDGRPTNLIVSATREDSHVLLEVSDNGPRSSTKTGLGIGLTNVRNRLYSQFGDAAKFETRRYESGFSVRMSIPTRQRGQPVYAAY